MTSQHHTPRKSSRQTHLHDSPFSDYFTDDNRSIDGMLSQLSPGSEREHLLGRLRKLEGSLEHSGTDPQALYLIGRRMSEIEHDIAMLHSQSRQPPELEDSGLFMEDDLEQEQEGVDLEKELEKATAASEKAAQTMDEACDDNSGQIATVENETHTEKKDYVFSSVQYQSMLADSTEACKIVQHAYAEMQQRVDEFVSMRDRLVKDVRDRAAQIYALNVEKDRAHDQHTKQIRDKDTELAALKTENKYMMQDLKLDHGDFVLLDGQLRLLQNRLDELDDSAPHIAPIVESMRADCRKAMDKALTKRTRYSDSRMQPLIQFDEHLKLGGWNMEVIRDPSGRVDMMTLERMIDTDHDVPHMQISEVFATTTPRKSKQLFYVNSGVQVETDVASDTATDRSDDDFDPRDELRQIASEDAWGSECAITTSDEQDDTTNDDETMNEIATRYNTRRKSAWDELWEGLAGFAGTGELDGELNGIESNA